MPRLDRGRGSDRNTYLEHVHDALWKGDENIIQVAEAALETFTCFSRLATSQPCNAWRHAISLTFPQYFTLLVTPTPSSETCGLPRRLMMHKMCAQCWR